MKITDFALIFIGIALPIIIVVYVNVSFTIKAVEEEMYYQKLVDSALADANVRMKEVESEDPEIDYGYSGNVNNKVSINAQVAADTFFQSLYNNFGIKGNKHAQDYLKLFVPALAIIDYNGVYISSFETFSKYDTLTNTNVSTTDHVVKPKRYFTFTYGLDRGGNIYEDPQQIQANQYSNGFSLHTIEFTMDDYVVHRGKVNVGASAVDYASKGFYLTDAKNNQDLYDSNTTFQEKVVNLLTTKRKEVIIDVITRELYYAVNQHNYYASLSGIHYSFVFPHTTNDEMFRYVEDIGMLAFVQGLSVGNKYLNYKSYGGANLELATRYYVSMPDKEEGSKYLRNLYHKDTNCPEYKVSFSKITPNFVNTKQQASSLKASINKDGVSQYVEGFYPCPICRP